MFAALAALIALAAPAAATLQAGTTDLTVGVPVDGTSIGNSNRITVDRASGRVFLMAGNDNRILFWNDASALTNGQSADGAIGQSDLFSTARPAASSRTLSLPQGGHVDSSGRLWVADIQNNRVLRFSPPFATGMAADLVLGQPDFTSSSAGTSSTTLRSPSDALPDASGGVWVADLSNHRLLHYSAPLTNGAPADVVLGQSVFTSSAAASPSASTMGAPAALSLDSTGIWASDNNFNRVLHFSAPFSSGQGADIVLGQSVFTASAAATTQSGFKTPFGSSDDGAGGLWVADYSNFRALHFSAPISSGMNADLVVGQTDFISGSSAYSPPANTASRVAFFSDIALDAAGNLYAASNADYRILRFPAPLTTNAAATLVLGQHDFTHSGAYMPSPRRLSGTVAAVVVDPLSGKLFAADTGNNRVLWWNSAAAVTRGQPADGVLGQADPFSNDVNAGGTLSSTTLNGPSAVAVDSTGKVWVADRLNSRVLRYSPPLASGMGADLVLGHTNFTGGATGSAAAVMSEPYGLAFSSSGALWIVDFNLNRTLGFFPPFANGMDASVVLGQSGMNTFGQATTAAGCFRPRAVAVDSSGAVWVAEWIGNSRVLRYPSPQSSGMSADLVLGKASFTASGCSGTSTGLCTPVGLSFDGAGALWVIQDEGQRTAEFAPPFSTGMASASEILTLPFDASGSGGGFVDAQGNLWAALTNVVKFAGATVASLAGAARVTMTTTRGTVVVAVPNGAFPTVPSATLSEPSSFPSGGSPGAALTPLGTGLQITLDQAVQPRLPVWITIPYGPADIGSADPQRLVIARYDPASGLWTPLASTVDSSARTVTAQTGHFSLFQLMLGGASASVDAGVVFPNPFRPALGHSSVTFASFPPGAAIRIYDLRGRRVKTLDVNASGVAAWDGLNDDGAAAASGVYFAVADGGGKKTFKLAIQR